MMASELIARLQQTIFTEGDMPAMLWANNPREVVEICVSTQGGLKMVLEPSQRTVGTEALVCDDIFERQQLGIKKYGLTVEESPLTHREWLQHAYEECLDQAVYLKRAISELQ